MPRVYVSSLALLVTVTLFVSTAHAQVTLFEEDFATVPLGTRVDDPSVGWEVDYAFPGTRGVITPVAPSHSPVWDVQDGTFITNQPFGGDVPSAPFVDPYPLLSYSMAADFDEVEDYSVAAITPRLDLSAVATATLEYDLFSDGFVSAPNDFFEIWLSDDDGTTWQGPFNQVLAQQTTAPATYPNEDLDLSPVAGSADVRVAFVAHGDDIFAITAWAFDNVEVSVAEMEVSNESSSQVVSDGGTDNVGNVSAGVPRTTEYRISAAGTALTIDGIQINATTNISGATGGVTVSGPGSTSLNPGDTTTFELTYTPQQGGSFSIDVQIELDQRPDFTFVLVGNALAQPEMVLEVQGSTVDANDTAQLGTVQLAGSEVTVTIRNEGLATLMLSGGAPASANGVTNVTANIVSQPGTSSLGTNESTTFVVSLTPEAAGDLEATVTVSSNDPTNPSYTIHLTGSATIRLASAGGSGCATAQAATSPPLAGWAALALLLALFALRRRHTAYGA